MIYYLSEFLGLEISVVLLLVLQKDLQEFGAGKSKMAPLRLLMSSCCWLLAGASQTLSHDLLSSNRVEWAF